MDKIGSTPIGPVTGTYKEFCLISKECFQQTIIQFDFKSNQNKNILNIQLGIRQVVRHRALNSVCVSSILTSPANISQVLR
jgi:hypothetical protein